MIGKLITAYAGRSLARAVGGVSAGPMGAVLGAALPAVVTQAARRMSPVGVAVVVMGGTALLKYVSRSARHQAKKELLAGDHAGSDTMGRKRKLPLPNMPV